MSDKIKLRVILSGGGTKGAYQTGVLSKILASGKYKIDKVYGCSIGAFQAPIVASEKLDALANFYKNIKTIDTAIERRTFLGIPIPEWNIFKLFFSLFKMGFYKRIKVEELIFNLISQKEFDDVKHNCHAVAYNITQNKETWFTGDKLLDGIKCSTALWLAVPPVVYKNDLFTDGGACEIFPLNYIINNDLNDGFNGKYMFVDCDTRQRFTNTPPTNGLALLSYMHTSAICKIAQYEEDKLKSILGDKLIIIRPKPNTTVLNNAFDIDPERLKYTLEMGERDGDAFLESQKNLDQGITMNEIAYEKKIIL